MKESQLEGMSLKQLHDLKNRLEKSIRSRLDSERSEMRERFKREAEEAGFSLADIVGGARGGKGRSSASAKYADPDNPTMTWSGRGRMPKWLTEKIKAGADRSDFQI